MNGGEREARDGPRKRGSDGPNKGASSGSEGRAVRLTLRTPRNADTLSTDGAMRHGRKRLRALGQRKIGRSDKLIKTRKVIRPLGTSAVLTRGSAVERQAHPP